MSPYCPARNRKRRSPSADNEFVYWFATNRFVERVNVPNVIHGLSLRQCRWGVILAWNRSTLIRITE
jgi:hypothetical protein